MPLDALVSADLLVSLFLPYSPLHDGAVFIRGDRVAAAGCFLPLSRNTQLGRAMGTRHRAAPRASAEETDAVVLVVSEESGRISLAVDGPAWRRPLDREALRRRLAELFSLARPPPPRAGPPGGSRPGSGSASERALTRHWELKLLALAVSLALWLFVMTSEKTDLILAVPHRARRGPGRARGDGRAARQRGRAAPRPARRAVARLGRAIGCRRG